MKANKISFYDWCINNEREDLLEIWDYEKNKIHPKDISHSSSYEAIFTYNDKSCIYKLTYITYRNPKKLNKLCNYEYVQDISNNKNTLTKKYNFYDWCIDNNRQNLLDRWDYNANKKSPKAYSYKSHKKIFLQCPRRLHDSEEFTIMSITNMNIEAKCKKCNSFGQWFLDSYGEKALSQYWDYNKNKIDPFDIRIGDYKQIIYLSNFENEIMTCKLASYYVRNYEARKVNRNSVNRTIFPRIKSRINILNECPIIYDLWSTMNTVKIENIYKKYKATPIYWKCHNGIHDDYERSVIASINSEFRCPECARERDESFLQESVRKYLSEDLKYKLNHEYNCSIVPINPKTKHKLPFDNEVIDENLIVEVHGIQHYEISGYHKLQAKNNNTTVEHELNYQKWKDKYKMNSAIAKGYNYLAIPYWAVKNDEFKILINNKIKKIKSNS